MKAAVFHELGGAEVLGVEDWEKETPKTGEVLIKVTSAGLNRADILFQLGRYYQKPKFPSRTGKEAAGIVEAVGDGVSSFKAGDRVAVLASSLDASKQGGIAEYVIAPEQLVIASPSSVDDLDTGGIWMQYMTAFGALDHVTHVTAGQHVIITAASSSVGVAAIQLVNMLGATPIATTTSAGKVERLKELGAQHVIDTKNEDYVARVNEITDGHGAEVIFDAVAGAMMQKHIEVCRPFGWIFLYGVLDVSPMALNPGILIGKNVTLRAYNVASLYADPSALKRCVRTVSEGLDAGKLKLVIDKRFPMSEVQDALRHMLSNQQIGKIVVNP